MSEVMGNVAKTRVELHVHLDGSIRHETIWELMKEKGLRLPGNGTFRDLKKALEIRDPVDLAHFLSPFGIYLPAVQDDFEAIERIAYEFCEDKARQHVAYVEARYAPHGLLKPESINADNLGEAMAAVYRGFVRGENDFGIKVGTILCTLIGSNTAEEVLKLCEIHRGKNVLGIDTAGLSSDPNKEDEVPANTAEARVFQRAARLGLHRTVHAGERGSADMVKRAVELYGAERIGHGYRVLEDRAVYESCLERKIHFECCPWSSFLTGSVPVGVKKHAIAVFADDGANFSISTDDPTVTGYELSDDYDLARKWGFTEGVLVRANLNAVRSCFLPDDEKCRLMRRIKKNLGLDDY